MQVTAIYLNGPGRAFEGGFPAGLALQLHGLKGVCPKFWTNIQAKTPLTRHPHQCYLPCPIAQTENCSWQGLPPMWLLVVSSFAIISTYIRGLLLVYTSKVNL